MVLKIHIVFIAVVTTIANPIEKSNDTVDMDMIKMKLNLIHEIIERNVDGYSKIVFQESHEAVVKSLMQSGAFSNHEAAKYLQEDEDSKEGSNVKRAYILFRKLYLFSERIYKDWEKTIFLRGHDSEETVVMEFWKKINEYLLDIENLFEFGLGSSNVTVNFEFEGEDRDSNRDIRDFIIFKKIQLYKDHFLKYHKCLNSSADEEFLIKCR